MCACFDDRASGSHFTRFPVRRRSTVLLHNHARPCPASGWSRDTVTPLMSPHHSPGFLHQGPHEKEGEEHTNGGIPVQRTRRVLQNVASTAGWRAQFEATANKDKLHMHERQNPRRIAARHALWAAIRWADGAACAAKTSSACLDPEMHVPCY